MKYLISGGGTGGHIFPAVSIANALKRKDPEADILFIGAEGKMEMEKVPQEGYRIIGLPMRGFIRPLYHPGNILVAINVLQSTYLAKKIIKEFKPDVAVGVGGYASAAAISAARSLNVPYILQEQNGFAGITNQKLAKNAQKICVAYPDMERFFPADKIVVTGNPVRQALLECTATVAEARKEMGLDPEMPTVFITGGSLGARSVNKCIAAGLEMFAQAGVQVLWQTGKADGDAWTKAVENASDKVKQLVHPTVFVKDMALAYKAADIVISRSGAGAVNEVCLLGKAAIFVPLPTAAEDHQTANAKSLSTRGAAMLIADKDAPSTLVKEAIKLVNDKETISKFETGALAMAHHGAADTIAQIVIDCKKK